MNVLLVLVFIISKYYCCAKVLTPFIANMELFNSNVLAVGQAQMMLFMYAALNDY